MKVFFSVGEPSGDLHGANLVRELRRRNPQVQCVGYGGPKMAQAGCELHVDLTELAVMWFSRVLLNLHRFWKLWRQADRYFRDHRPSAVILIDYPGFNWWIARSAKKRGIPVFYYGVPQMWAWAGWRVKKMRRLVDHVLCKLPFEVPWFRERGCQATYVGHPYFDEVSQRKLDASWVTAQRGRAKKLVTILPGSRTQEVQQNLPTFLRTAALVQQQVPDVRFAIAAFNRPQAELARQLVTQYADADLSLQIFVNRTPELIEAGHCCLACSGSVSLELLYHEKPTVIHYRVSSLALYVQGFFRKVKYITLVNLLASDHLFPARVRVFDPDAPGAERVPFPEYLTCEDKSRQMARHLVEWLVDGAAYRQRLGQLRQLKERFAVPGASRVAADYIQAVLQGDPIPPPVQLAPPATRPSFGVESPSAIRRAS